MDTECFGELLESVREGGRILRGEAALLRTHLPERRAPTHPGRILREEFLEPLGMTQKALATSLGVSYGRINRLLNEKSRVTPEMALRLARFLRTTPEFWLNGQRIWDLWHVLRSGESTDIQRIHPIQEATAHLLLRSPRNAERLRSALHRSQEGRGDPMELEALSDELGLSGET